MRKKIKVTRKFISQGSPCSSANCPIALAIKNKLGLAVTVGIDSAEIFPKNKGKGYRFSLSKRAEQFISDFDKLKSVKPFAFFITLPKNYIK